jgi:hypothetical protein
MEATYPFVEAEEDDLPEAEVISNVMAYPNPFNPEVTISFSTTIVRTRFDMAGGGTENTEVCIYNIKGQRLRSFKIQNSKFKINQVVWDGADERGRQVSTGVYLYQIRVGGYKHAGKVIMLK